MEGKGGEGEVVEGEGACLVQTTRFERDERRITCSGVMALVLNTGLRPEHLSRKWFQKSKLLAGLDISGYYYTEVANAAHCREIIVQTNRTP